jgi:ribosome-associated toxin RatA of RatAB toxin-antitoxin module
MAEQTTSSIVIAASPAEVMAVIADFPAYPEWAQGMKKVEVVEQGAAGRADKVHFELEAAPIKDSYTLGYVWNGDTSVTWDLVEGKMLKAMNGAYELREAVNATSTAAPFDVDEFDLAKLEKAASIHVKPPRVAASPANLECKLLRIVEIEPEGAGDTPSNVVFGRVVGSAASVGRAVERNAIARRTNVFVNLGM